MSPVIDIVNQLLNKIVWDVSISKSLGEKTDYMDLKVIKQTKLVSPCSGFQISH